MFKKFFTTAAIAIASIASIQAAPTKQVLGDAINMAEYMLWETVNYVTTDSILNIEESFTYTNCDEARLNRLWDNGYDSDAVKFHAGEFISFYINEVPEQWDGLFWLHMEGPDTRDDLYDVTYETMTGSYQCIHSADGTFRTPSFGSGDRIVVSFNEDCEFNELFPATRHHSIEFYVEFDDPRINERYVNILEGLIQEARDIYLYHSDDDALMQWTLFNLKDGFSILIDNMQQYVPDYGFTYLDEITYDEPVIEEPVIEEPVVEEPTQEEPKGRILSGPTGQEETGIRQLTTDGPVRIYDLNGRAVKNPTHGIYIINGRKVRL